MELLAVDLDPQLHGWPCEIDPVSEDRVLAFVRWELRAADPPDEPTFKPAGPDGVVVEKTPQGRCPASPVGADAIDVFLEIGS
jgi:hypothetical protein